MWMGEVCGCARTWAVRDVPEISADLVKFNTTRPRDIHRSIRKLDVIKHWKGTEFRAILLYVGVVVFRNHLPDADYELFKTLFAAVTICTTNAYKSYLPLARHLFNDFIEKHIEIYGENSITINIHNTSHVVDDVQHLGWLETISAYPFENCLQQIKLKLKKCDKPLQQIARRTLEVDGTINVNLNPTIFAPKLDRSFVVFEHSLAYQQVEFKQNAVLSSFKGNAKDKWFITHRNEIVEFHFIVKRNGNYDIHGSALKNTQNFFENPFDSRRLNIFLSDGELNNYKYFKLNEIKAKMFCMPYGNMWVFVPLLHTL